MPDQYPFVISNNRIASFLDALSAAARPQKLTQEFLRSLGFTSTNDRALIPLFRKLGFLNGDGAPTDAFDVLRVKETRGAILAEKLRELYADLFAININMQDASDNELRGAISRITGKDAATVARYASTFRALANLADFKAQSARRAEPAKVVEPIALPATPPVSPTHNQAQPGQKPTEFHYNMQIHLPATSDVAIYNAIFRSLKENLGI
ncbi:DUF5343 domain-containing protein [Bradyrhizobium yuanmingense]|uniref:DUF5343 domain-containing protein n=1 Tax=Bradyrhizobium yuanmingense TaxID=108015 RepID=UPI0023B88A88|nr:DUF5343 domain-containing protein [Bradyrhizobium yuanmingense]MDF0522034.1 DUF5343 domain-containing protein [Bradyrhizobium yuanmingense]